jgi:rare lipoprotein A
MLKHAQLLLLSLFLFAFADALAFQEIGIASYYSDDFQGRKTASGEAYDKNKLTAAHKTLPFGTMIRVTRLDNNKSVVVRVNDRGPYISGRIVDLSRKAAQQIGLIREGNTKVKVEVYQNAKESTAKAAEKKEASEKKVSTYDNTDKDSNPRVGLPEKVEKELAKMESKKVAKEKTSISTPPPPKAVPAPVPARSPYPAVTGKNYQEYDLYQVALTRPQKKGYGVQAASLKDYRNVLRQVADLQEDWFNQVMVSVERDFDGYPIYKIILGPYATKSDAVNNQKSLKKKKKLSGFVIDLSKFNMD